MKDKYSAKQLTVMNDRAQAASALENGQAQFMQHRRVPGDDGKGMGEPLDERDILGFGIRVKASYYL